MIEALRNRSNVVISALLVLLLVSFFIINIPFVLPFIIAGIFALGLNDFINRTAARTKMPRGLVITIVTIVGLAIFWIPLSLAIYRLIMVVKLPQNLDSGHITQQLNTLKNFAVSIIERVSNTVGVDLTSPVRETLDNLMHRLGAFVFSFSTDVISSAPSVFFNLTMFLIFLVVLLVQANSFKGFVMKYTLLNEPLTEKIIQVVKRACATTLFSTFVIGVIQACTIGFGSLICGEGDFWIVTPITFVLSFIPVIGAAPVGFLLALLAFIGGRNGAGFGMVAFATVAGTIDNLLKPILISGKNDDTPAIVGFTCVVGAVIVMGLPGLLIGPVICNVVSQTVPILIPELHKTKGSES